MRVIETIEKIVNRKGEHGGRERERKRETERERERERESETITTYCTIILK